MPLSDAEIERYARQIIIPRFGAAGQERLLRSKVIVIGDGCGARTAATYLQAAGVGINLQGWSDCFAPADCDLIVLCNPDEGQAERWNSYGGKQSLLWFAAVGPACVRSGVAPQQAVQAGRASLPAWMLETAACDSAAVACALLAGFPYREGVCELDLN